MGVFQIKALANLLQRLIDRIPDFLDVHLADDIERIVLGHTSIPQQAARRRDPKAFRPVPLYQFPTPGGRLNNRAKFFVVAVAISSELIPSASASVFAVCVTQAGSFRLPRRAAGASQGASVSTSTPSSGIRAATSRKGCA